MYHKIYIIGLISCECTAAGQRGQCHQINQQHSTLHTGQRLYRACTDVISYHIMSCHCDDFISRFQCLNPMTNNLYNSVTIPILHEWCKQHVMFCVCALCVRSWWCLTSMFVSEVRIPKYDIWPLQHPSHLHPPLSAAVVPRAFTIYFFTCPDSSSSRLHPLR